MLGLLRWWYRVGIDWKATTKTPASAQPADHEAKRLEIPVALSAGVVLIGTKKCLTINIEAIVHPSREHNSPISPQGQRDMLDLHIKAMTTKTQPQNPNTPEQGPGRQGRSGSPGI